MLQHFVCDLLSPLLVALDVFLKLTDALLLHVSGRQSAGPIRFRPLLQLRVVGFEVTQILVRNVDVRVAAILLMLFKRLTAATDGMLIDLLLCKN